jgi:hypothetical protein
MTAPYHDNFSAASVKADAKRGRPRVLQDADGDLMELTERPEFLDYARQVCELLEREGVPMGTRAIHEAIGYEHRGWTIDALETLVLKVERIDGGTMTKWMRKDLQKKKGLTQQERNDIAWENRKIWMEII